MERVRKYKVGDVVYFYVSDRDLTSCLHYGLQDKSRLTITRLCDYGVNLYHANDTLGRLWVIREEELVSIQTLVLKRKLGFDSF